MDVRDATLAELDAATLYRILALRSEVFVVEQNCVYLDPDHRDLEPATRQVWIERDGDVLATLRILVEADGTARIGRVATAKAARGEGAGRRLMARALELCRDRDVVLEAQTYVQGWYRQFGFEPAGEEYMEDGIPHVPMRRARAS